MCEAWTRIMKLPSALEEEFEVDKSFSNWTYNWIILAVALTGIWIYDGYDLGHCQCERPIL